MNAEYTLKIDFKKYSESPERVFKSMADLIQSFRSVDKALAESVCMDIEPILLLQEVKSGSIKTQLASVLRAVDDSALKELNWKKRIGSFLVKGKYRLIEYLEDKESVDSIEQIEEVQAGLVELAKETDVLQIPAYTPISLWNLLNLIQDISNAIRNLLPDDSAIYLTDSKSLLIAPKFSISQESIEELLTKQSITHEKDMILKVKKPDYLGQSMWDMKHDMKSISVKIIDKGWLTHFQRREVSVLPGDSLYGLVRHQENFDQQGELVTENYQILKVHDVIKRRSEFQLSLMLENPNKDG